MVVIGDTDLDENYIAKVPYNGTGDTGGDPMVDNLNIWYEVCAILQPAPVLRVSSGLTTRYRVVTLAG